MYRDYFQNLNLFEIDGRLFTSEDCSSDNPRTDWTCRIDPELRFIERFSA